MRYTVGTLTTEPVLDRLDLVAEPVAAALHDWPLASEVGLVAIDAAVSDSAASAEHYDLPLDTLANCVLVAGKRSGEQRVAACLIGADARADVNGTVKRHLDVRKASFLPREDAVGLTQMEYGGITPIGLPDPWPVLVEASLVERAVLILGSGIRGSKLLIPGRLLPELPGAQILADLASTPAPPAAP